MRFSPLVTSLCLLCCIPQDGWCLSQIERDEFLHHVIMKDPDDWLNQLDRYADLIAKTENPKVESRQFLRALIEAVNARHGGNVTVAESCREVRKHLHIFPTKIRSFLKKALVELANSKSNRMAFSQSYFNNEWAGVIMFTILCAVVFVIALLQPAAAIAIVTALTTAAIAFVNKL